MVFLVDQKSASFKGIEYVVAKVVKGSFRRICKEFTPTYDPSTEFIFCVRQEDNNLLFVCNDKEIYRYEGQSIKSNTKVGIYSYRNVDAVFKRLSIFHELPAGSLSDDVNNIEEELKTEIDNEDFLESKKSFLEMKTPMAKTILEYNEVFHVPLDSFYASLYQQSVLAKTLPSLSNTNKKSSILTVDYRPRHWYRTFRQLLEEEAFCLDDLNNNKKYIKELEQRRLTERFLAEDKDQSITLNSNVSTLEDEIVEQRSTRKELLNKLNSIRDQKQNLLCKMKMSGYKIEENGVPKKIHDLGYDFYIAGQSPFVHDYEPIHFPYSTVNYRDATTWKEVKALFAKNLVKSLPDPARQQYEKGLAQLESFDANSSLLNKVKNLLAYKHEREKYLTLKDGEAQQYQRKLDLWEEDKHVLSHQIDRHKHLKGAPPDSFARWLQKSNISQLKYSVTISKYYFGFLLNYKPSLGSWAWAGYKLARVSKILNIPGKKLRKVSVIEESGDPNYNNFISTAVRVCDHYINEYKDRLASLQSDRAKVSREIAAHKGRINDLQTNGLAVEREKFVLFWNDPEKNQAAPIKATVIYPDDDPLTETIKLLQERIACTDKPIKVYYFSFESNGFYSKEGYPLREIHKFIPESDDFIAVLPAITMDGRASRTQLTLLLNPGMSQLSETLPIIKFVETYIMEITWKGYSLGELSHSFNLFPGESKELIIKKKTVLTRKQSKYLSKGEESKESKTSSFEDSLEDTFSQEKKKSLSQKRLDKEAEETSTTSAESESRAESETTTLAASASAGYGPFSAEVSAESQDQTSANWSSQRNNALKLSQEQESQKSTAHSDDILKKNIQKAIKKVASDVSRNNKVEVKESTTEDYTEESSEQETINIQNPNMGRSINYNFFQLQNVYETTVRLSDVKIVLSMEAKLSEGYTFNDSRVYDLEEFGKIFEDMDGQDPRSSLVACIVARQVIKKYGKLFSRNDQNHVLQVSDTQNLSREMFDRILLSASELDFINKSKESVQLIEEALVYLKSIPFSFNETTILESATNAVNMGAYHLESEVGSIPATEQYLEERRNIETEKQRAALDHLRQQTKSGVFYPNLPSGVTTLTLTDPNKTNSVGEDEF